MSPCSPSVFPSLVDFSCDTQAFSHCDLQPIASLCRCIDSPADLSKLESIRFGDTTFLHTPLFYLANLEKLRVVTFGPRSFFNVVTMHFANLPSLETISFQLSSAYMVKTIIFTNLLSLRKIDVQSQDDQEIPFKDMRNVIARDVDKGVLDPFKDYCLNLYVVPWRVC